MFAAKEEDLFSARVLLRADSAHVLLPYLIHSASIKLSNVIVFDATFFHCVEHFLVEDRLKCLCVDAVDRRLVRHLISVHYGLPLIVPVYEVQIVLPSCIYSDWCILIYTGLFRRVR